MRRGLMGVLVVIGLACSVPPAEPQRRPGRKPGENEESPAAGSGYGPGLPRQAHIFGERPTDRFHLPLDVAVAHPLPPPPTRDLLYRRPRQGPHTRL